MKDKRNLSQYLVEQTEIYFRQVCRCLQVNGEDGALALHSMIVRLDGALSASAMQYADDSEATRYGRARAEPVWIDRYLLHKFVYPCGLAV